MQTIPCLNVPIPAIRESKIFFITLAAGGKGQIQLWHTNCPRYHQLSSLMNDGTDKSSYLPSKQTILRKGR